MQIKVVYAPTHEIAQKTPAHVTVEAEYGTYVIEGDILTLAHHQKVGPYSTAAGAPAPCNARDQVAWAAPKLRELGELGEVTVLVSHLDLDTIGGIARVWAAMQNKAAGHGRDAFWRLAEYVDLNGAHKLEQAGASTDDVRALNAFWAWAKTSLPRLGRDKADVTTAVLAATGVLEQILVQRDENLLAQGDKFAQEGVSLNRDSFVELAGGVVVRTATGFVNHLYNTPQEGPVGRAVVAFTTTTGAVTISLADPIPGVSCREIVQQLWGPEAGGHDGIAGSPRGRRMTMKEFSAAVEATQRALSAAL